MKLRLALRVSTLLPAALLCHPASAAELGACKFNSATLRFAGSVDSIASCLLRQVKEKGSGAEPQPVPAWLGQRMTRPVPFTSKQLERYLAAENIALTALGDELKLGDRPKLHYFVIHDTSSPEIESSDTTFSANINDASWSGNRLAGWDNIARKVNLIITRDGRSRPLQPWGATRPSPATKLEQNNFVAAARPLFAHVENIQPRIKPPGSWGWRAPVPGFSPAQEKRLALAYIYASLRAGRWLIPAYHFNIDQGLSANGHDDPQHADLAKWTAQVAAIEQAILAEER